MMASFRDLILKQTTKNQIIIIIFHMQINMKIRLFIKLECFFPVKWDSAFQIWKILSCE